MREILFRGKSEFRDEWVYGFYSPLINHPYHEQTPCIKELKGGYIQIKLETLGQYSGFKDKNGKEIYEGDCFGDSSNREIDVVVFEDGCFKLKTYYFAECSLDGNAYESKLEDWGTEPLCNLDLSNDEIIGNIFDNPELLRGEYE